MKLDKWDALFGFLIAFVNSGAKVLTGFALSIGFREANPFMQNPANVLSGLALIVLIIFALFLLLDPYRKLGLSTLLGVLTQTSHAIFCFRFVSANILLSRSP